MRTPFISELILGNYYLAEVNPKTGDNLIWHLVPAAYDGKIVRIPWRQVPRKVWRRAHYSLIEVQHA